MQFDMRALLLDTRMGRVRSALLLACLSATAYGLGIQLFDAAMALIPLLLMGGALAGGFWPMMIAGAGGLVLCVFVGSLLSYPYVPQDVLRHTIAVVGMPVFAGFGELLRRNRNALLERQREVDRAYADLRKTHGKLEVITTSVPGVIFQYVVSRDQRHGFSYLSPNVQRVFGMSHEALLQDSSIAWQCIHQEDRRAVRDAVQRAMSKLTPWVQEFRVSVPSSPRDVLWISVHAEPHVDRSLGTITWTGMVSVDTVRRELQDRAWKSQRLEGIGVLAGGIAHDFNNVLTAIITEVDLLELDFPGDQRVVESVSHIRTAAESGATLSRHLLGFAGRAVFAPRVLPIEQVLSRVAPLLRRLLREQVQLEIEVPSGLGNVRVDPGLFDQVLMNLATNARDAMGGAGSLRINAVRHDHARPEYFAELPSGPLIEIIVQDTGPGMPEEVRAHAFEPFYTTKHAGRGSGLGLATSHGIVTQAGGAICIDPGSDQGCTIRIALPVSTAAAADETSVSEPGPAGAETLLVVDDEHQVRRVTTETLRRRGYHVLEASSAADALRLARRLEQPIDLVITDVVMPEMDGVQLAATMAREGLARGVLYVSGYAAESMKSHGIDATDIDLLTKPYRIDALASRVRARLDAIPPT